MTDLKGKNSVLWEALSPGKVGHPDCRLSHFCCEIPANMTVEPEDHCDLYMQAGTVYNKTGMTPSELLEQRDELLAACKKYQLAISKVLAGGCVDPNEWYEDILLAQNIGAQYIRKSEGKSCT